MSQLALQLKDQGQKLAFDNAGLPWKTAVTFWLEIFLGHVRKSGSKEFTFEEFRMFCAMNDLPEPNSLNAWGALPRIAVKRGWCQWSGRVKSAVRGASHGRIIKVWELV